MALVTIYQRGKIEDVETTLKRHRRLKPNPALLTSFSHRAGALLLGIFLFVFGLFCAYILFAEHLNFFQTVVIIVGVLCSPVGIWIVSKALFAFGRAPHSHSFFYYDDSRIVMGKTNPIDQAAIKRIQGTPKAERIGALTALSPGFTVIPIRAIEFVGLQIEKTALHIGKMKIRGGGAEIVVDFDKLLPSLNFSGLNGDIAFNSISQFYTRATDKTITASIENF